MKIIVKAKPNSKEDKVEKTGEQNYSVSVKAPPVGGKANDAIIRLLADYFDVSPSMIEIISGYAARTKVLEVKD